jgi:hypothetical protein
MTYTARTYTRTGLVQTSRDGYYETNLKPQKHKVRKHKGKENKVNLAFDISLYFICKYLKE